MSPSAEKQGKNAGRAARDAQRSAWCVSCVHCAVHTCSLEALGSKRGARATCKIDQDLLGKLDRAEEQLAACGAGDRSSPAGLLLVPKQRPVNEKAVLSRCPRMWRLLCPAWGEPPSLPPPNEAADAPPPRQLLSPHEGGMGGGELRQLGSEPPPDLRTSSSELHAFISDSVMPKYRAAWGGDESLLLMAQSVLAALQPGGGEH